MINALILAALVESPALMEITERGRFLQAYDQAAWHGSDAAMAIAGNDTAGLGMFIAHKDGQQWIVDFGDLNQTGDAFTTVIEATSSDDLRFTAVRLNPGRADQGFNFRAARAIKTAEKPFQAVPRRRYNVAVLPNADGTMYVYMYPAQTDMSIFPIGGDERYKISSDGSSILEDHRMHQTILDIPMGKNATAGLHTDLFSDMPEDTDVFHVLARTPAVPDYVDAKHHLYRINEDGTIYDMGPVASPSPKPSPVL